MTGRGSNEDRPRALHVGDLIGAPVEDSAGRTVGRVVDLEVRPHEDWQVVALVLGRSPVIDRFDLFRAIPYRLGGFSRERLARWTDVASFDGGRLRLRAGARLVRASGEVGSGTGGEEPGDRAGTGHEATQ